MLCIGNPRILFRHRRRFNPISKLTRRQIDNILTCYDEARTRPRGSAGAWHLSLIQAVRDAGYDVVIYEQACDVAIEISKTINGGGGKVMSEKYEVGDVLWIGGHVGVVKAVYECVSNHDALPVLYVDFVKNATRQHGKELIDIGLTEGRFVERATVQDLIDEWNKLRDRQWSYVENLIALAGKKQP